MRPRTLRLSPTKYNQQKLRVLVVDSDRSARASAVSTLSKECRVVCAESARQALRLLCRSRFDLVIYDAASPSSGGLTLLRDVKLRTPETAVVLLMGRMDLRLANLAIRHGALDCVVKPLSQEILRAFLSLAGQLRYGVDGRLGF